MSEFRYFDDSLDQGGLFTLCSQAKADFPQDFKVPLDEGGPPCPYQPSPRTTIGGFGGDPTKDQAAHRAVVQSVGKAPIILIHGHGGSADLGRWAMTELRKNLMIRAGYPLELLWAPSYLGRDERYGGELDLQFPHTHNVGEIRAFIDNVCEYLGVEAVDIFAHSLGCSLAYSVFRGLKKQTAAWITEWSWSEPKKWYRVGTFVALAGAFRGLSDTFVGEWQPDGDFMNMLLEEQPDGDEDETPYQEGGTQTPGPAQHFVKYFCGIAEDDYADRRSPNRKTSTSMLEGAHFKVYKYEEKDPVTGMDLYSEWDKHERIIKDPTVIDDVKDLLSSVPPVSRATLSIDMESGDYEDDTLEVTAELDAPETVVSYVANRFTLEPFQGSIVGKIHQTIRGTGLGNQTKVSLNTPGMWEVLVNPEGAVDGEKRTYWIGATKKIEVTVETEELDSGVTKVKASPSEGELYHSLSGEGRRAVAVPLEKAVKAFAIGEGWSLGDTVITTGNAEVSFVAITPNGNASAVVTKTVRRA